MRHIGFGFAALSLLGLGIPEASACGWLWACGDRPYTYRDAPRTYPYRPPGVYGYRRIPGSYGFTSPERVYGYPYAAWPSASIPPRRWYLGSTLPGANTDAVGLTAPIASQQGLLESGLPAKGPSLFGPSAPPSWSYYNGGYYGTPAYGYYAMPSPVTPPRETASWWLEPPRRR
jgi:hypothetical protein